MREDKLVGRNLKGEYQIIDFLGKGGMSSVFLAEKISIVKKYAIKQLNKTLSSDPFFQRRFFVEAETLSSFQHNNIVSSHDFFLEDDHIYLVVDYISGITLSSILEQEHLPVLESLRILKQLLSGMAYAHDMGVIHCDLKPANIRIQDDGTAKILDFGLARNLSALARETGDRAITGTPAYLAPEQIRQEDLGPYTDIYAFGVIFFEMVSGRLPFEGKTPLEIMEKHVNSPPPKLHEVLGTEIEQFDQILLSCLAKRPEDRYESCDAFLKAIVQVERSGHLRFGPEVTRTLIRGSGQEPESQDTAFAVPVVERTMEFDPTKQVSGDETDVLEMNLPAHPDFDPDDTAAYDMEGSEALRALIARKKEAQADDTLTLEQPTVAPAEDKPHTGEASAPQAPPTLKRMPPRTETPSAATEAAPDEEGEEEQKAAVQRKPGHRRTPFLVGAAALVVSILVLLTAWWFLRERADAGRVSDTDEWVTFSFSPIEVPVPLGAPVEIEALVDSDVLPANASTTWRVVPDHASVQADIDPFKRVLSFSETGQYRITVDVFRGEAKVGESETLFFEVVEPTSPDDLLETPSEPAIPDIEMTLRAREPASPLTLTEGDKADFSVELVADDQLRPVEIQWDLPPEAVGGEKSPDGLTLTQVTFPTPAETSIVVLARDRFGRDALPISFEVIVEKRSDPEPILPPTEETEEEVLGEGDAELTAPPAPSDDEPEEPTPPLSPPRNYRVIVMDREGNLVPDKTVTFSDQSGQDLQAVRSDANGMAEWFGRSAGQVSYVVDGKRRSFEDRTEDTFVVPPQTFDINLTVRVDGKNTRNGIIYVTKDGSLQKRTAHPEETVRLEAGTYFLTFQDKGLSETMQYKVRGTDHVVFDVSSDYTSKYRADFRDKNESGLLESVRLTMPSENAQPDKKYFLSRRYLARLYLEDQKDPAKALPYLSALFEFHERWERMAIEPDYILLYLECLHVQQPPDYEEIFTVCTGDKVLSQFRNLVGGRKKSRWKFLYYYYRIVSLDAVSDRRKGEQKALITDHIRDTLEWVDNIPVSVLNSEAERHMELRRVERKIQSSSQR